MSYDIYVAGKMSRNMTSNVAPMWDKAMLGMNLRDMDGKTGTECLPHLKAGLRHMAQHRHEYEELNPENGWGSFGSALAVLVELYFALIDDPAVTVHVTC